MLLKKTLCILLLSSCLTGCMGMGPNQSAGQLLGAATGAVIGSQFGKGSGRLVGTALGTLAGVYIGGAIGQKMDERDRAMSQQTMTDCLEHAPDHQARSWRNPNNNHAGRVQVKRTQEYPAESMVCREYVHTVMIEGCQEQVHGRACRNMRDPHSKWVVQN